MSIRRADLFYRLKNKNLDFQTWIPDSRPLEPVLGRKFHVESEFEVKNTQFRHPEAKNLEKLIQKIYCLVVGFFSGSVFISFPLWSLKSIILCLKFGFYVKIPP